MIDEFLNAVLCDHVGCRNINKSQRVTGGCINETAQIQAGSNLYFLKWNTSEKLDLFDKEVLGLRLLDQTSEIKTPDILR
ncbi:MAG: fructosamine kinase family protein, partial [Ekhidna sp.]|nr:fructosamine kinase family protein [Ekhidna sp.]